MKKASKKKKAKAAPKTKVKSASGKRNAKPDEPVAKNGSSHEHHDGQGHGAVHGHDHHAGHSHDHQASRGPELERYLEYSLEALKASGARVTKPRLAVLESLARAKRALTPRELLEVIKTTDGSWAIDQATVYRIVEAFMDLGLVHRIGPQGAYVACAHLGCEAELHVVAYCTKCELTLEIDLPVDLMARVRNHVEQSLHFAPSDHFFQMNGTCEGCRGA